MAPNTEGEWSGSFREEDMEPLASVLQLMINLKRGTSEEVLSDAVDGSGVAVDAEWRIPQDGAHFTGLHFTVNLPRGGAREFEMHVWVPCELVAEETMMQNPRDLLVKENHGIYHDEAVSLGLLECIDACEEFAVLLGVDAVWIDFTNIDLYDEFTRRGYIGKRQAFHRLEMRMNLSQDLTGPEDRLSLQDQMIVCLRESMGLSERLADLVRVDEIKTSPYFGRGLRVRVPVADQFQEYHFYVYLPEGSGDQQRVLEGQKILTVVMPEPSITDVEVAMPVQAVFNGLELFAHQSGCGVVDARQASPAWRATLCVNGYRTYTGLATEVNLEGRIGAAKCLDLSRISFQTFSRILDGLGSP